MNLPNLKIRISIWDVLCIILGSLIYAISVVFFLDPNNITPGGVTGISMVLNHLFPVMPLGVLIIMFNIPLFMLGWRSEGRSFLIKSLIGTILSSVFIDVLDGWYVYTEDYIMAALAGGVLMGAGLGLIFIRGGTTGGSDIVARLLNIKFPGMTIGRIVLLVDACIILLAALVYGHINYALYSVVAVFIASTVLDRLLIGVESTRVAYIITSSTEEVTSAIINTLDRGVTLLHGEGAFSHESKKVIMCAIRKRQITMLKEVVRNIDPTSFVIIMEAHEVLGDGFRAHIQKKD